MVDKKMLKSLKALRQRMNRTRIFLHFIRNSTGYTMRYHYMFIEIVGAEKYFRTPLVRNEWHGARNSFDKMYGLVSAWCESFEIFEGEDCELDDLSSYLNEFVPRELDALKNKFSCIENQIPVILRDYEKNDAENIFKNYLSIKKAVSELENEEKDEDKTRFSTLAEKTKKAEKIVAIYKQMAEFSELLN